jgi:hypothetical protein
MRKFSEEDTVVGTVQVQLLVQLQVQLLAQLDAVEPGQSRCRKPPNFQTTLDGRQSQNLSHNTIEIEIQMALEPDIGRKRKRRYKRIIV